MHIIEVLGRILLSSLFLIEGVRKFFFQEETIMYMEEYGVPEILFFPSLILEILFPILLIIGYKTRISALIMALFTLTVAIIFHTDFQNQMELIIFLKDIAIAGGFLVIASNNLKFAVLITCLNLKQNEERWKKMFNKYKPGEAIVRFRGNMESKNTVMRDPVLFRIINARHPLLLDKYRVWPSYDFAVAIEDSIDGITHAFRSKEYELRNELYYAILDALNMRKPKMLEFSRLEFKGMPVSKRIIRPLMEKGKVSSLDDPRLPTLAAMMRRGITPEAIRKFTTSLGFTKAENLATIDTLEAFNRTIVDKSSIRLFMVKNPKILTINNLPSSVIELPNHPSNDLGTRQVEIENSVLLSSEDVKELKVGNELRLMGLGNVKITSIKSEITGEFTGDDHKVDLRKIQWVSQKSAHRLKILIPHQLFIDDEFNEGSLEEVHAYTVPLYLELKEGTEIQFVRFGYCRKDSVNQAIFTHK